jgi:two-component system, NtrC family, sensor kinase
MKLAAKLIVALALGVFVVMAINTYFRLVSEVSLFTADTVRDLRAMARAVAAGAEAVWAHAGEPRAQQLVRDVNRTRDDMEVRWVWWDEVEALPQLEGGRMNRLDAGNVITFVKEQDGEEQRFMYWPLRIGGDRPAALELRASLATQHAFIAASRRIALFTTIGISMVCTLIAAAVGYWFVGRPIGLLRDKARRVGAGDLAGPLALQQRDEIGELAGELNSMCDQLDEAQQRVAREGEARIAMAEQLRHADRLKTVGQLASGVAHELGTPLNVVSGHARMIRRGELQAGEIHSSADVIVEQTNRMTAIIRQLLDFSRRRGPQLRATDLRDVTARTLEMLGPLADKRQVELELASEGPSIPVEADPNQLQQALANLIVNGIQASAPGGAVEVRIVRRHVRPPHELGGDAADYECVVVSDHGDGIARENLPHLFEPFFTTKDVGEGTGLGLAVAYGIVREHGGWIDVESRVGEGSRFSLFLRPVRDGAAETAA